MIVLELLWCEDGFARASLARASETRPEALGVAGHMTELRIGWSRTAGSFGEKGPGYEASDSTSRLMRLCHPLGVTTSIYS